MIRIFSFLFALVAATQVVAGDVSDERANLIITEGEVLHFDVRKGDWGAEFVFLISFESRIYLCDVEERSDRIDVNCLNSIDTSPRYLRIPDGSDGGSMRILRTD